MLAPRGALSRVAVSCARALSASNAQMQQPYETSSSAYSGYAGQFNYMEWEGMRPPIAFLSISHDPRMLITIHPYRNLRSLKWSIAYAGPGENMLFVPGYVLSV